MIIRKSIWVECALERSFNAFCGEMANWWPGGFAGKDAKPQLELRVGGRFFEKRGDGSEYDIGRVTAYDPPSLVAFSWRGPSWDADTQVEVRFSPEKGGTRIELEHSGWENGTKPREFGNNYESGWDFVLGEYAKAANA